MKELVVLSRDYMGRNRELRVKRSRYWCPQLGHAGYYAPSPGEIPPTESSFFGLAWEFHVGLDGAVDLEPDIGINYSVGIPATEG
jgi:hypothetical protein